MKILKTCLPLLAAFLFLFLTCCKEDNPAPNSTSTSNPATNPEPDFKLEKVSGDNQFGFNGMVLDQLLRVRLLDKVGAPAISKIVIFAKATEGEYVTSVDSVATDQNGEAQVTFKLGSGLVQAVTAYLPDAKDMMKSASNLVSFTAKRKAYTIAREATDGSLQAISSIFVDAAGNIFVVEKTNHRVLKWGPGATKGVTVAGGNGMGKAANQLWLPTGVFVDATGNIYVSDTQNNRVQKWAPGASFGITVAGKSMGTGGGNAADQLFLPQAIFVDASGNIYVADNNNHRIQKWAPGASSGITVAGGNGWGQQPNQLTNPTGVFVDAAGNVFAADRGNYRIQKWAPGATSGVTVAGGNGLGSHLNQMGTFGVFVDTAGDIFVVDKENHRIQKWAPGSSYGVTVAGNNSSGGKDNQLSYPESVFVDAAGNIFIADTGNRRVQKWLP